MLKLPPPVWALVYVLFAVAISWPLGWPKMPGFPLPPLGIALVTVPWILPVWAIIMFRREGTEVSPTSCAEISSGNRPSTSNANPIGIFEEPVHKCRATNHRRNHVICKRCLQKGKF